jgi:hypothetical protein
VVEVEEVMVVVEEVLVMQNIIIMSNLQKVHMILQLVLEVFPV